MRTFLRKRDGSAAVHLTWCTASWVIYNVRYMVSPEFDVVQGSNENTAIFG